MKTVSEIEESTSIEIQPVIALINNEDQHTQKEAAGIPGGNEKKIDEFINQFGKMLERPQIISSKRCLICKVPNLIRRYNEEAYTPQVVSIGPFHHKNERLKAMEEHKVRYFRNFMTKNWVDLADFVGVIKGMEERIRWCYGETIDLDSDEFVRMVLLDAIFILELFSRYTSNEISDFPNAVDPRDTAIMVDLLLLENQLPFFVLEKLCHLAFQSQSVNIDFLEVSFGYYIKFLNMQYIEDPPNKNIEHFTDLIRSILIPPRWKQPERNRELPKLLYSATRLHEVGVKFEADTSKCYFDIKFERGVLKISSLQIGTRTEVLARNILALEQTRYREYAYYADYFIFLDLLIRTGKDVELLCDKQILVNNLGDNYAAKSMINNINRGLVWGSVGDNYVRLCADLNDFYEQRPRWQKWKTVLKRDFFGTPSAAVSTIITVFVITVLTFIQTVCSLMQVTDSRRKAV